MTDESGYLGKQVGNYRIVTELASGSYGSVYLGKHVIFEDDPVVAIKLLHAHLSSSKEREQFTQEARLLKKLKHPHILPVLDAGVQNDLSYLVTEYASGGSLRDHLKKQSGQPFPLEEAITILSQIGQALHHAHQRAIVHRDLKPENILFNAQDEALLADFGIATVLATASTKQIGRGGTPAYMAPEQFEGIISMKSDQYALGCVAYELVTGQKPFMVSNWSIEAMWYQHAHVNPVAPTRLNPRLPAHIEQAILKALAKQRADRHADVSIFIATLQKSSKYWLDEGAAFYNIRCYEEALAAYEQAIGLAPNDTNAYLSKGATLQELKRDEEALAAYEQAIGLAPNDASAYFSKGATLRSLKRDEEALAAYEQAIGLAPNYAITYYNKGNILSSLKRYEEALTAYEQVLRLAPKNPSAYRNKGAILHRLNRYEEALAAYEEALRLAPNSASAYFGKGTTLRMLKRYKEALVAYEHALYLVPNDANVYCDKGATLYRLKRYEEALVAYEQVLYLTPNGVSAHLGKGATLYRLKRYEEALKAYMSAVRFMYRFTRSVLLKTLNSAVILSGQLQTSLLNWRRQK